MERQIFFLFCFIVFVFVQQMLLNAAKDVASALGALINATKNASGKSNNDPSTEVLKTTGKVLHVLVLTPPTHPILSIRSECSVAFTAVKRFSDKEQLSLRITYL